MTTTDTTDTATDEEPADDSRRVWAEHLMTCTVPTVAYEEGHDLEMRRRLASIDDGTWTEAEIMVERFRALLPTLARLVWDHQALGRRWWPAFETGGRDFPLVWGDVFDQSPFGILEGLASLLEEVAGMAGDPGTSGAEAAMPAVRWLAELDSGLDLAYNRAMDREHRVGVALGFLRYPLGQAAAINAERMQDQGAECRRLDARPHLTDPEP